VRVRGEEAEEEDGQEREGRHLLLASSRNAWLAGHTAHRQPEALNNDGAAASNCVHGTLLTGSGSAILDNPMDSSVIFLFLDFCHQVYGT
jgi:hypothetical protein